AGPVAIRVQESSDEAVFVKDTVAGRGKVVRPIGTGGCESVIADVRNTGLAVCRLRTNFKLIDENGARKTAVRCEQSHGCSESEPHSERHSSCYSLVVAFHSCPSLFVLPCRLHVNTGSQFLSKTEREMR